MTAVLQRFTQVRREEVAPVLASALSFFFILTALMVLRPAREALGMRRGIESIRWLFVGTAVVTLAVNPVFGLLVSRFRRLVFINATYLFFAASLLVFYALLVVAPAAVGETSGMVFFVWFSVFNLFATTVFWSLLADRFSLEQSKRLFGVIAVGGTLGAVAGPWLASRLAEPLGTAGLLLLAAGSLGLAVLSIRAVAHLQPERARPAAPDDPGAPSAADERAVIGGSAWEGLRAVFRSPYLVGVSAYMLILAVIATLLYFTRLQMVAALGEDLDVRTTAFAQARPVHADHHPGTAGAGGGEADAARRGPGDAGAAADHRGAGLPGARAGGLAGDAGGRPGGLQGGAARRHAPRARDALHRGEPRRQVQVEGRHRHLRLPRRRRGRRAGGGGCSAASPPESPHSSWWPCHSPSRGRRSASGWVGGRSGRRSAAPRRIRSSPPHLQGSSRATACDAPKSPGPRATVRVGPHRYSAPLDRAARDARGRNQRCHRDAGRPLSAAEGTRR
jgi:MFS family permease